MAYTAVNKASSFQNQKIYLGTGSSQSITGLGFQPDFTWIKCREYTYYNVAVDAVRGATKYLYTNATSTEATSANYVASLDADGFTVGTSNEVNSSTYPDFVTWNWKAGTTSGLTGGTITPSAYSFNATSGFGVYKFTGTGANATIPHGLGVAPKFIIVKNLDTAEDWFCYHEGVATDPETDYLNLNTTAAAADNATIWNDTAPTSTVFSVGTANAVNKSGDNIIAYCFADVKGYSRMGSYQGNGDSDGPFVYTGFRPSFVMIKNSSSVLNWTTRDNARDIFNPGYNYIYPNLDSAGTNIAIAAGMTGSFPVDFYATGFKLNNTDTKINESASTFVYAAFGQTIVGTNGVVGTAR